MDKRDFFISYNQDNKDWAKWVAGTLQESNYTVYLQAWDIIPGDDFINRMNEFLSKSTRYIAIWSKSFSNSEYCKKEFQTAFNEHLKGKIELFLPVRIDNEPLGPLYNTIVYIDMLNLNEEEAKERLLQGVKHSVIPRVKGAFPQNNTNTKTNKLKKISEENLYPGIISINSQPSNCTLRIREIIILESEQSKKGELFNRLVYDAFHALGFDHPTHNLHRSGREINMVIPHRTENKVAFVEVKSGKSKVSGADINRFVGMMDVDRKSYEDEGKSVVGYFVSRLGFTAKAVAQEKERNSHKSQHNELILFGPENIAHELIQGNVICSLEKAVRAVRLDKHKQYVLCENVDLLCCEYGWIWVLYFSEKPHQQSTWCAFVHADGNQLLNALSEKIIEDAKNTGTLFAGLEYIKAFKDHSEEKEKAKQAYFTYLSSELGDIQFEGMPTDTEAGTIRVSLESIFVPLLYNHISDKEKVISATGIMNIEDVLTNSQRAAILAKPGGGKSTLIRRIALAYAFPERRKKVDDQLPDRNWFPIYIRCRDLGNEAEKSITEIMSSIVYKAEISQYSDAFKVLVEDALQDGCVLLLIDGLDEISSEQQRICFVNQLRTFVATYPTVHLLITSREAGFRAVAGTLVSYCERYSIANLNEEQIRTLSEKWHIAIQDNPSQAKTESEKVCNIILSDPRIVALAENPLLLTTLLFVKRWVGYLPTKKCQLYEEMIKLLLVTWNAAGHHRLDLDETEPQLAFVAHYMTINGQQRITKEELAQCIVKARRALPDILGYTTINPSNFIDQVEERSSLLIQQGLEENRKGKLVPCYEFSHLSFQEYLTAKAVVENWIPEEENRSYDVLLKEHLTETQWIEVIPLMAVLLGRQAKTVVDYLLNKATEATTKKGTRQDRKLENIAAFHLANCIASEVPMSRNTLEDAIRIVIKNKRNIERTHRVGHEESVSVFNTMINSKYGVNYRQLVLQDLFSNNKNEYLYEFSDAWIEIYQEDHAAINLQQIKELLMKDSKKENVTGALLLMQYAFSKTQSQTKSTQPNNVQEINNIFSRVARMLNDEDELSIFAATWCLAWSGYSGCDIVPVSLVDNILDRLTALWIRINEPYDLRRNISWCICSICMPNSHIKKHPDLQQAIEEKYENPENEFDSSASLHLGIISDLWSESVIQDKLHNLGEQRFIGESRFLTNLGYLSHTKNKQ